jgi:hypothetical protein
MSIENDNAIKTKDAFDILDVNGNRKIEKNELTQEIFEQRLKGASQEVQEEAKRLRTLLLEENGEFTAAGKKVAALDEDKDTLSWEELWDLDTIEEDGLISDKEIKGAGENSGGDGNDDSDSDSDSDSDGTTDTSLDEEILWKLWSHLTGGNGSFDKSDIGNFENIPDDLNTLGIGIVTTLKNILVTGGKLSDAAKEIAGEDDKITYGELMDALDLDDNNIITDGDVAGYNSGSDDEDDSSNSGSGSDDDSSNSGSGSEDDSDTDSRPINANQVAKINADGSVTGPEGETGNIAEWGDGVYKIFEDDSMEVVVQVKNGKIVGLTTTIYNEDKSKALVFTQDHSGKVSARIWHKNSEGDWGDDQNVLPAIEGDAKDGKGADGEGASWHHELRDEFGIQFKYFCPDHQKESVLIQFLDENGYTIQFGDSRDEQALYLNITASEYGMLSNNIPKGVLGELFDDDEGQKGNIDSRGSNELHPNSLPPFIDWDGEGDEDDEESNEPDSD